MILAPLNHFPPSSHAHRDPVVIGNRLVVFGIFRFLLCSLHGINQFSPLLHYRVNARDYVIFTGHKSSQTYARGHLSYGLASQTSSPGVLEMSTPDDCLPGCIAETHLRKPILFHCALPSAPTFPCGLELGTCLLYVDPAGRTHPSSSRLGGRTIGAP